MLVSSVLTVIPTQQTVAPANLGRAAHAQFLRWIRAVDSDLSDVMHDANQAKPFTVSSLQGLGRVARDQVALSADREYWLRFTSLDGHLSDAFISQVIPALPSRLSLGNVSFTIARATVEPDVHAWAGTATYEQLVKRCLIDGDSVTTKITLQFLSPTTFRSQGKNVPVPTPHLVFGSLLDKWNAMSGVHLHPDTRQFASDRVAISRFSLRSRSVSFGRFHSIGCVGICTYEVLERDPYWMRVFNLLADFALYAGVGSKTTVGLGQVRRRLGTPAQ